MELRDLYRYSYNDATRFLYEGRITQDTFDAFHDMWKRSAPRFADPYVWSESDIATVRAEAIGPIAASTVARFLDYCARGVLFLGVR